MRKTLAVLLSVLMVASLAVVGISAAPEGKAVNAIADITDPAGTYYLNADLAISATIPVKFTGTIDGNGHKITVSAPCFTEFAGTVKNLTIEGSVDTSAQDPGHTGTIAQTVTGNATFENITNKAPVKGLMTQVDKTYRAGTGGLVGAILSGVVTFKDCVNTADITGHAAGGLVGSADDKDSTYDKSLFAATFINCKNSGHVNVSDSVKVDNNSAAGGILGIANKFPSLTFQGCENSGKVESDKASGGPAGGIVAYVYTNFQVDEKGKATFTDCKNSGEVISADSQAGGITGWARICSEFTNCVNTGYIHSGKNGSNVLNGYCGGIACRTGAESVKNSDGTYTTPNKVSTVMTNCLNSGKVESGRDQAGGMIAYHNGGDVTLTNCTNSGRISYYGEKPKNNVKIGGVFGDHGDSHARADNNFTSVISCIKCVNSGELVPYGSGNVGAIIEYVWGNDFQYPVIKDCVNTGTIKVDTGFASQFVGYSNTSTVVIDNSVAAGKIEKSDNSSFRAIVGYGGGDMKGLPSVTGNTIVENDGTEYFCYSKTEGKPTPALDATFASQVKIASAADAQAAVKALGKMGYVAPQSTNPSQPTGDAAVWAVVIAAVSLLGMGVALKARKA